MNSQQGRRLRVRLNVFEEQLEIIAVSRAHELVTRAHDLQEFFSHVPSRLPYLTVSDRV